MSEKEINHLIGRATVDPEFKTRLLNPETRLDALNDFQEGREEGVVHAGGEEPRKGRLTPRVIKSLMEIKADDLPEFASGAQVIDDSE